MLERELHVGLLGMMLLDCEEREKNSNCLRGFFFFLQAAMPFSSSVQQPLSSCASSNSPLEFKGGSSSTTTTTTTWRTGSWTRSSLLLLRVCVHPAIPLYPSKTFAVHLTSSQSAPDRNRGGIQRSLQFPCRSERETMAEVLFGSFTMVGSHNREDK